MELTQAQSYQPGQTSSVDVKLNIYDGKMPTNRPKTYTQVKII